MPTKKPADAMKPRHGIDTEVLQIAEELGSVEVGVSGGDTLGVEFWRVRARPVMFCIAERVS